MSTLQSILADHAARYPLWSVQDIYKLLFQSVMGSEHAVTSEAEVEKRLAQEIDYLVVGPQEPKHFPRAAGVGPA